MVSLYCGLNLLFHAIKRPSIVLHLTCSICVNDSRNCRPFLLSHFLWLLSLLLEVCYTIWWYCLPVVWSCWVDCTCLLLPSWMWVISSWVCWVWVPHFVFILLWPQPWPVLLLLLPQPLPVLLLHWYLSVYMPLYVYVFFLLMSAYRRLLLLTPCSVSCLSEDNTGWCLYAHLLLLHEIKSEHTCVHDYIYVMHLGSPYLIPQKVDEHVHYSVHTLSEGLHSMYQVHVHGFPPKRSMMSSEHCMVMSWWCHSVLDDDIYINIEGV